MGKSSKPLHIKIDKSLYDPQSELWTLLSSQGHVIEVVGDDPPDLYLAPYAMRMTPDIMAQLPTAFELAVKGARALRYGPQGKQADGWQTKKAKRKPRKEKQDGTTSSVQDTEGSPSSDSTVS